MPRAPVIRFVNCGCFVSDDTLLINFRRILFYTFVAGVCLHSAYVNYKMFCLIQDVRVKTQLDCRNVEHAVQSNMDFINRKKDIAYNSIYKNENFTAVLAKSLEKYEADKTGMADFALQSLGGKVVSIRDTKNYNRPAKTNWLHKIRNYFNNPVHPANEIIQPNVSPGNCWAFEGNKGIAIIKMGSKINVKGVSLEHIPKSISPNKEISSAPRRFSLVGLENHQDEQGFAFGSFEYKENGNPVQYFEALFKSKKPFNIVGVNFTSNWGNEEYTCIYRVRIHGDLNEDE